MRFVLTTALVFASSAAFASSITPVGGVHPSSPSIIEKRCADCPDVTPKAHGPAYKVPELAQGTQKMEIIDINGEKKLVRTEAWLGGSPVIHVSKLPGWMAEERAVATLQTGAHGSTETQLATVEASRDGIDIEATTGAVVGPEQQKVDQAAMAPLPLSLDRFELRLR
jgi:hypothetical protein